MCVQLEEELKDEVRKLVTALNPNVPSNVDEAQGATSKSEALPAASSTAASSDTVETSNADKSSNDAASDALSNQLVEQGIGTSTFLSLLFMLSIFRDARIAENLYKSSCVSMNCGSKLITILAYCAAKSLPLLRLPSDWACHEEELWGGGSNCRHS